MWMAYILKGSRVMPLFEILIYPFSCDKAGIWCVVITTSNSSILVLIWGLTIKTHMHTMTKNDLVLVWLARIGFIQLTTVVKTKILLNHGTTFNIIKDKLTHACYCSNDLEHFEMSIPSFEVADEINKSLSDYEAMWFLLEDFNSGLQELAKEDWISFR